MKAQYNLIVVDMQAGFPAAKDKDTIKNVEKEVKAAIEDGAGIIVLEMEGAGKTLKSIKKLIDSYKKTVILEKKDTSGAVEVLSAVRNNRFLHPLKFKVCGVYTDCCVADTVNELSQFDTLTLEILADSCNCDEPSYLDDIDMFEDDGITYDPYKAILPRENVLILWK
jgi:nicotinamidase-related amidase